MSFEKLLDTMGTLAKAQAAPTAPLAGNKKTGDAANTGGDPEDNDDQTNADTGNGGDGLSADGITNSETSNAMSKSFVLTLEDGTSMEAFDGTELVKSLTSRLEATESELAAEKSANQATQANVLKSLEAAVNLISQQSAALKSQEQMLKSLSDKVTAMGREGRGARSVQSVDPKTPLAKSLNTSPQQLSGQEILAKSMAAFKAGRITGFDATRIETSLNMGVAVPADLLATISSN
jgi:hypothetical protein